MSADIIDTNVVEMRFDNEQFVKNVSQTIDTVDKLKASLEFDSHSFDSLTRAANNIDLSRIATGVEALSDRFSGLGIVGMTAIQRITNEVMTLGGKLAKLVAKPWQQIITGGTSRASNIEQARFQLKGLYGDTAEGAAKLAMTMDATAEQIQQITGYTEDMVVAMDAANYAVADTAYGLDSAAKAASVLATSGIDVMHFSEDLKDASGMMRTEMQVALRAISGSAAMANASYDEMAHTFERVAGNGRVMAIDLQSFSARGLNAAATIRDYLNEIGETANATEADIRDMVSKGQISFMTLANAMDSAYGDHAKDANNTFTGALSNMKFGLSKIGADFIAPMRQQMIPLFNDLRLSINNVRKALNFKMKFPWNEREVSIVDLFTNAVTNLSNKLHELFVIWMGGQDMASKAMTGLSETIGVDFATIKNIFEDTKNGTKTVQQAIDQLRSLSSDSGETVNELLEQLQENLGKTDSEIQTMCRNGEISFEDFSNAASAAFGNARWDSRVQQLATIFQNLVKSAVNVGDAIGSVVAPIVIAFFKVFKGDGVNGIIGATSALVEFTDKLRLSRDSMDSVSRIATVIAKTLKTVIKVVLKLASAAFKVLEALSPLLAFAVNLIAVLADIVSALIDVATESQLLQSVAIVLVNILTSAVRVIAVVLMTIISILKPAIMLLGQFFTAIAKGIGTIDLSFLNAISDAFEALVNAIASGQVITKVRNAIIYFLAIVASFFSGIELSFEGLNNTMNAVTVSISERCSKIAEFFSKLGEKIKGMFTAIFAFFSDIENIKMVIAIIEEVIAFGAMTGILTIGNSIAKAIKAFAHAENAKAIHEVALAFKNMAQSILMIAAAMLVFSLINTEKVIQVLKLMGATIVVLLAISGMLLIIKKLVATISDSKGGYLDVLANGVSNFLGRLGKGLQSFLKNAGKAAKYAAMGALVLSIVASIFILYKAVAAFASMSDDDMIRGGFAAFTALTAIIAALVIVCNQLKDQSVGVGVSLLGAAAVILSLTIAIKLLQTAVQEYADMDWTDFLRGFGEITLTMISISAAAALIATNCKQSGTSMMQAAIVLLAFTVALKALKLAIDQYAEMDPKKFVGGLIAIYLVLRVLTGALKRFSEAIGDSTKSFSASLRGGVQYQSAGKKFLGIMITMLGLVVVLKAMVSVMEDISRIGFGGWIGGIILLITTVNSISNLIASMKGITNAKALTGVAAMMISIALTLMPLTLLDTKGMISAAASIAIVLWAIASTVQDIAKFANDKEQSAFKTILAMAAILTVIGGTLVGIIRFGGQMDQVLSIGLAMAAIILTLGMSLTKLNNVKFNGKAIGEMAAILMVLGLAIAALNLIKIDDPLKFMSVVTGVAILGMIMAEITKIISGTIFSGNEKDIIITMVSIAGSLGIMAIALGTAGRIFNGEASDLIALSVSMLLMIPLITTMVYLAKMLSTSSASLWQGIAGVGAIVGVISLFTLIISAIAQMGDVNKSIALLNTLGLAMLALIPFVGIMALASVALGTFMVGSGGIGAIAFVAGLGGLISILGLMAAFLLGVSLIANKIGDVNNTIALMSSIGSAMTSMIPFILTMELLCTILGAATPLLLAGVIGFGALSVVILAFVAAIAGIAMIGDVKNTIYMLNGLTEAMLSFKDFLGRFMLILALVGSFSPLVLAGTAILKVLFDAIISFVMQVASIATVVDPETIRLALMSILASLNQLAPMFATIIVIGQTAPLVVSSAVSVSEAISVIFELFAEFSRFNQIGIQVINAITLLTASVESLISLNDLMLQIGLNGIVMLDTALRILDSSVISKMTKLTIFTAGLVAVSAPLIALNKVNEDVKSGLATSLNMMNKLLDLSLIANRIGKLGVSGVQAVAEEILKIADTVMIYCGHYTVAGFVSGVLDNDSRSTLSTTGKLMGAFFTQGFCQYLDIHSPSGWFEKIAKFLSDGLLSGVAKDKGRLMQGGEDMANTFGLSAASNFFTQGQISGDSFMLGLTDTLGSYDLESILGGTTDSLKRKNNNVLRRGYYDRNAHRFINQGTSHGDNKPTNPGGRPYYSPAISDIEEEAEATSGLDHIVSDLLKDLNGLLDTNNLLGDSFDDTALSAGGLGSSFESAGKSASELENKIDDLMDRYEKRFETARERANKDLFEGVDEQGDDFLDKVKDIMDEYENIFESAVERTNNQDLFAEINDEDESFAPETLLHNLEDQVNQINELNTIISSLSGRIADRNLAAAISNMDVDDLPQLRALYRMNAGQLAEYETMYQRKVQANQNKIQNELSGNLSQLTGSYVDVASYVATDASTNRLLHNLEAQVNKLNEYNDTVSSLMVRIKDVHLREAIATMGVESLDELKQLNSMTDAQLDEYIALYNRKIDAGVVSVTNELSSELSELLGQPLDISEFYEQYEAGLYKVADNIASGSDGAKAVGRNTGEQIASELNNSVIDSVDDQAAYDAGKNYVESIGRGMADSEAIKYLQGAMDGIANMIIEDFRDYYTKDLIDSGIAMATAVIQGIEQTKDAGFDEVIDGIPQRVIERIESYKTQFIMVGKFIVQGIKEGMGSPDVMRQVEAAAAKVAYTAISSAKNKLKIKSPSRVFEELGKFTDMGFAKGLRDYSGLAEEEAGNMATDSVSAVQSAIDQLSGILDGSIDINPVITPTLDLSDLNARSAALDSMFNSRRIAIQARSDEQQEEMIGKLSDVLAEQNSEPRTMTFNQNNYSPKALSRTEIYRQTRNGFSQLASAIQ